MKLYDWIIITVAILLILVIIHRQKSIRKAEINRALNMVEEMRGR